MQNGAVDASTHYATLELHHSATRDEIRQSFRRLILLHHPDRQLSGRSNALDNHAAFSDGTVRSADVRAEALNTAYDVLYDPEKRTAYDEQLRLGRGAGQRYTSDSLWRSCSLLSLILDRSPAHNVSPTAQRSSQAASHGAVSQTVSIDDFVTKDADRDLDSADIYYYPSRCGDDFKVGVDQLEAGNGEVVLGCEGCTERIRVVYEIASEE